MNRAMIVFLALQVADLVTTLLLYRWVGGDPAMEANPLARAILAHGGAMGLAAFKAIGVATVVVIWTFLPDRWRDRLMDVSNGIMLTVVCGNCLLIMQLP